MSFIRGQFYIPSWMKLPIGGSYVNSATLVIPNTAETGYGVVENKMYGTVENDTTLLTLNGQIDSYNDENMSYYTIDIGNTPPNLGKVHIYSDNSTDVQHVLSGTNSAHIIYFEHALFNNINFTVPHNHVITRIHKIYRNKDNNSLNNDDLNTTSKKLTIANENQQVLFNDELTINIQENGTQVQTWTFNDYKLKLVERS